MVGLQLILIFKICHVIVSRVVGKLLEVAGKITLFFFCFLVSVEINFLIGLGFFFFLFLFSFSFFLHHILLCINLCIPLYY